MHENAACTSTDLYAACGMLLNSSILRWLIHISKTSYNDIHKKNKQERRNCVWMVSKQ